MTIDDLGFFTEEEAASERGAPKPLLVLIGLAVIGIAFALVSGFSWLLNNSGTESALEEYTQASQTLDSTSKTVAASMSEHDKIANRAEKAHAGGLAIVAAAAKDRSFFAPASSINDLKREVARLTKTANLVEKEDGSVTAEVTQPKEVDRDLFQFTANNDRQTLKNATRQITDSQATLNEFTKTLTEDSKSTKEAVEAVREKSSDLIAAARASHKAWERPAESSDEAWANYQDALSLLRTAPEASLARQAKIVAKYVKTRNAVQKSHDKKVAAIAEQQRLAYQAAQQRAAAQQQEAAKQRAAAQRAADQKARDKESRKEDSDPKPKKTQDHQGRIPANDVVYQSNSCTWSNGQVTYLASKGWTLQSAVNHCAGN